MSFIVTIANKQLVLILTILRPLQHCSTRRVNSPPYLWELLVEGIV